MDRRLTLGAIPRGRGPCTFCVWAPAAGRVDLRILGPRGRLVPMNRRDGGYHHARLDGIHPGTLYVYRLDGLVERPDPASRCQPQGSLGPSCIIDHRYAWTDRGWTGLPLGDVILHEGPEPRAAFDDLSGRLEEIKSLGATALSIRIDEPGGSLSGYPFAAPADRGGVPGLRRLADACHRQGLAVMLSAPLFDPGVEGDPFTLFGPYFTDRPRRIRLDGPGSDEVRRYFIESVLWWFREVHVDVLDVGSIDDLTDPSPLPLLEELRLVTQAEALRIGRPLHLVARSGRGDPRLIRLREDGGIGLDAVWNPDFGDALEGVLARGRLRPPQEVGSIRHLKKAFLEGFAWSGEFSSSRQQRHGRSSRNLPGDRFLVRSARPACERERSPEERKLIAAALLLCPFVPLIPRDTGDDARQGGVPSAYVGELARLRKELRDLGLLDKQCMGVLGNEQEKLLLVRHWKENADLILLFHFGRKAARLPVPVPAGAWALRFDSAHSRRNGPGSALPERLHGDGGDVSLPFAPLSCAVYLRQHGE